MIINEKSMMYVISTYFVYLIWAKTLNNMHGLVILKKENKNG